KLYARVHGAVFSKERFRLPQQPLRMGTPEFASSASMGINPATRTLSATASRLCSKQPRVWSCSRSSMEVGRHDICDGLSDDVNVRAQVLKLSAALTKIGAPALI